MFDEETGHIIARGIQRFFSSQHKLDIYDCNGHLKFIVSTGNFILKILNMNDLYVSLAVEDGQGNVLSYIQTNSYFDVAKTHRITNREGKLIALSETSIFHSAVNITLITPDDAGADLLPLIIAFAQKMMYSGKHTQHTADGCNNMHSEDDHRCAERRQASGAVSLAVHRSCSSCWRR